MLSNKKNNKEAEELKRKFFPRGLEYGAVEQTKNLNLWFGYFSNIIVRKICGKKCMILSFFINDPVPPRMTFYTDEINKKRIQNVRWARFSYEETEKERLEYLKTGKIYRVSDRTEK